MFELDVTLTEPDEGITRDQNSDPTDITKSDQTSTTTSPTCTSNNDEPVEQPTNDLVNPKPDIANGYSNTVHAERDKAHDDDGNWFSIKKILGTKISNGQRMYRVQWEDDTKEWRNEVDVTDEAKRIYHENFTLAGKLRKR